MPSRMIAACIALATILGGCGDDGGTDVGDERAEQTRGAALEAGLDEDVADFLALLARGDTATYRATFPGPVEGTSLIVRNRPPDRRVDLEADGEVVEVRQVIDGEAFACTPAEDEGWSCERTDALVEAPGLFSSGALDRLRTSLAERSDDYDFSLRTREVAGVGATCLVTRLREGRDRPELGDAGTICASPEGAVLLVERGDEQIEATDYAAEVDPATLERVDRADGDEG